MSSEEGKGEKERTAFWIQQAKNKARDLLFADCRLHNYQITCPVCGRSRNVQRTDFWRSLRYPKTSVFLMPDKLNKITSFLRTLPDFLIIGAAKSGTTSLYSLISAHPHVLPARVKEIRYFASPRNYLFGLSWYRSHFPIVFQMCCSALLHRHRMQTGEANPINMFHQDVPGRVKAALPNVRLIAILRNPIDRAYSEYNMQLRKGHESLTFEDAIDAECNRSLSGGDGGGGGGRGIGS